MKKLFVERTLFNLLKKKAEEKRISITEYVGLLVQSSRKAV